MSVSRKNFLKMLGLGALAAGTNAYGLPSKALQDARAAAKKLKIADVELAWTHRALEAPWVPGGDGVLLARPAGAILWSVPIPRAEASVTGHIGASPVAVAGYGYLDFVQTSFLPWRIPLREMLWGRALSPSATLIWERPIFAGPSGPEIVTRGYFKRDGAPARIFNRVDAEILTSQAAGRGGRYPTALALSLAAGSPAGDGPLVVRVDNTRLLTRLAVTETQDFGGALKRWLYRQLTGNPVTFKLWSQVSLSDGGAAFAAHEYVRFGRRAEPGPARGGSDGRLG